MDIEDLLYQAAILMKRMDSVTSLMDWYDESMTLGELFSLLSDQKKALMEEVKQSQLSNLV